VNREILATNTLFFLEISYNLPKFCSNASWDPNAITFVNNSTVGSYPYGSFVDNKNTLYVVETNLNSVQVWLEGSMTPTRNISGGLNWPAAIFATSNGDIYVDNTRFNYQIDKWTLNATNGIMVLYVNGTCFNLFVDIYDNIYCSMNDFHKVVKKSFNDSANTTQIVAGNGSAGSAPNMLNFPLGIFVDVTFNLYVADCRNNRVQLFASGYSNGTTVAGDGANGTITLNCPVAIVIDGDGYLFISDSNNWRIVGSGPNGFKCLVGCTNTSGSASDQLNSPWSLSFDSYGNIFVDDVANGRIQKFLYINNSCGRF
jgi:hypothetical protein